MSTAQPKSAHSPGETQAAHSQSESISQTQQATTPTPNTRPEKNPKRVAAGKAIAEKRRLAREAQAKALAEAENIIVNNNKAKVPAPPPAAEEENPKSSKLTQDSTISSVSNIQWLAVGSLVVSLVGIYYKREELKAVLRKTATAPRPVAKQPQQQPAHAAPPTPKGIRSMD